MARLTKKAVAETIIEMRGNISAVARRFDKSRKWIYEYCKEKYPELWEVVEEAREMMVDDAEAVLQRKILQGDTTSLIFYLKTQGKQRGYVERQEQQISGAGGSDLVIRYVNDWRNPTTDSA